jgi:hypothetical protein
MTTRIPRFQAPPVNMVQQVRNTIEGYSMGPIRALAQDPPQNSYDARRPDAAGPVVIDYRLYRRELATGEEIFLLSVTDRRTTGLRGAPVSLEELYQRPSLQLGPDENWAAWEAMGYTKIGEDYLGSRGQGKSSFLYASRRELEQTGPGGIPLEGMVMVYDTLLQDGTYRLGLRRAWPIDGVWFPPFEGEEAIAIVTSSVSDWGGTDIPLLLEPLTEIGTRIIVPFLHEEPLKAFRTGELARWLERCWWRAIQTGALKITVGEEGREPVEIGVPSWWKGEPWIHRSGHPGIFVRENLMIDAEHKIKRLVIYYDPELPSDEIDDFSEQFEGIQLLRGHQWIETMGAHREFGDLIPQDKRAGFRGFVEFDQRVERELREIETPQHDGFRRHRMLVKSMRTRIKQMVREFAQLQGWIEPESAEPADDRAAKEILQRIADLFVDQMLPDLVGPTPRPTWICRLDVDYPRRNSVRVDWEESLEDIMASCFHEPPDPTKVRFELSIVSPSGARADIDSQEVVTSGGNGEAEFGALTIRASGQIGPNAIVCRESGKYRLQVKCIVDGTERASAFRNVFVEIEPPERPPRPFTVEIKFENANAPERKRVNSGEAVNIVVTVGNGTLESQTVTITGSLGELLFADEEEVTLPGRLWGDSLRFAELSYAGIRIFTQEPSEKPIDDYVVLAPGRHFVRVDVRDFNANLVAHAAKEVYVETDPEEGTARLPFTIKARQHYLTWELEPPAEGEDKWILWYSKNHPKYEAAVAAGRLSNDGAGLYDTSHFFEEMVCAALIEWAMNVYRSSGDAGSFKLLPEHIDADRGPMWEKYKNNVEDLMTTGYNDAVECLRLQRELHSVMLALLREGAY